MPIVYEQQAPYKGGSRLALRTISQDLRSGKLDPAAIAAAIESIQNAFNNLSSALSRAVSGEFLDVAVTDTNTGEVIGRIGSFGEGISGGAFLNLWVGGSMDDPEGTSPLFSDGQNVVIGQNGRVFIRNTRGDTKGFIGIDDEAAQDIVSAVDNGSGLIRLEVTGHAFESGETVDAVIPGVANGTWHIAVIDADHFDLSGSTFTGSYTGSGTVYRYFGGLWGEVMAAGNTGPQDALFRVFADSSLRIGAAGAPRLEVSAAGDVNLYDAEFTLDVGDVLIEITAAEGVKVTNKSTGDYSYMRDGQIQVRTASSTGPRATISKQSVTINAGSSSPREIRMSVSSDPVVEFRNNAGTKISEITVPASGAGGYADFRSLKIAGIERISNSGVGSFDSVDVGAVTAIDSSRNGSFINIYTRTEVDALIAGLQSQINLKSDVGHSHSTINITGTTGTTAHTHTGTVS